MSATRSEFRARVTTKDGYAPTVGLGRARDLLHARSSEAVTLDDLVQTAECGTKQRLIRGFRAAFGFTPHQYSRTSVFNEHATYFGAAIRHTAEMHTPRPSPDKICSVAQAHRLDTVIASESIGFIAGEQWRRPSRATDSLPARA